VHDFDNIINVTAENTKRGRGKRGKNKLSGDLRESILTAFHALGGRDYLVRVGRKSPALFFGLLARVVPSEVKHSITGHYEAVIGVRVEEREPIPGQVVAAPVPPVAVLAHVPDDDDDWLALPAKIASPERQ
jgi:hypothetical protein